MERAYGVVGKERALGGLEIIDRVRRPGQSPHILPIAKSVAIP